MKPVLRRPGRLLIALFVASLIGGAAQAATLIHAGRVIDGVADTPKTNQTVVVEGQGVPRLDGRGRGNLVAVVQIDVPKKLSSKAKGLLKDLRAALEE